MVTERLLQDDSLISAHPTSYVAIQPGPVQPDARSLQSGQRQPVIGLDCGLPGYWRDRNDLPKWQRRAARRERSSIDLGWFIQRTINRPAGCHLASNQPALHQSTSDHLAGTIATGA